MANMLAVTMFNVCLVLPDDRNRYFSYIRSAGLSPFHSLSNAVRVSVRDERFDRCPPAVKSPIRYRLPLIC
jgi:hypothetical protein